MSSEAREAKERVLAKQAEVDDARLQMSELRKTVERMGSEGKISKDDWVSKEAGFVDMLKRSDDDGISSIQLEMNRLMESLRAAENEVQELRADKTLLLSKLHEFEVQATNTEEQAKAESSHLKYLLSVKDKELLALNHELAELHLRESVDKSKALQQTKLETDNVLESLKAAEGDAKAAKEEKEQLQNKLRLLESKITEANLTSEEAKISSLRLKETLEGKEHELASIVQENREVRARELAAQAKVDELAVLLAEAATARKGELSNAAVTRSPERQPTVLLKMICSPMHHNVRDDENNGEIIQNQKEDIKHVEVETVRQVKHEKESGVSPSAVAANSLENSKIIEDDLSKERDDDSEPSDDDDDDVEFESTGDDALVDQMNGLLIHGPTSSFSRDQRVQKKKRALLKKFGSLLKKKAHFTKLSSHSHS